MKSIVLAKKLHRIIAGLIDGLILTVSSALIFMFAVFPNAFDGEQYQTNQTQIVELYRESNLFICSEDGNYAGKCTFDIEPKLENLYSYDFSYYGAEIKDNSLTKDLYEFYTTLYTKYGAQSNLNFEGYCTQILKVNTQNSNIASFNPETYELTLLDSSKEAETVEYFLDVYETAAIFVEESTAINSLVSANQTIIANVALLYFPVAIGVSFFTLFLMPILMPNGQTIGKLIFGIGVLDKDGYGLKKGWYLPRWLAYIFIEYILSFLTLGGAFLISFTMFQFAKKRRCIHDFLSNSVVIDIKESLFFKSKEEEKIYIKYSSKKHE